MAEIRGRGRILAAQLFLSTTEKMIFTGGPDFFAGKESKKCTGDQTRMERGLNRIDFRWSL